MINLLIICLLLLIVPFLLGIIHSLIKKSRGLLLICYRYFVIFNVIISGLFVTGRMFFDAKAAASFSGWPYSPVYHLYGIAVLSMVILAILTIYSQRIIMLAPAICWSVFLILSTVSHIYQIAHHVVKLVPIIYVHIIYNIIVAAILFRFIYVINGLFEKIQFKNSCGEPQNVNRN